MKRYKPSVLNLKRETIRNLTADETHLVHGAALTPMIRLTTDTVSNGPNCPDPPCLAETGDPCAQASDDNPGCQITDDNCGTTNIV